MARLWSDGLFEVVTLAGAVGAASALKVAYAAWSKGTAALLLAVRAYARAEGIEGPLLAEWERSVPGLLEQSELSAWGNAPKAWRFVDEMDEIARAFGASALPSGFGQAAAEVYRDLASFRDAKDVAADDVFDALTVGDPEGLSSDATSRSDRRCGCGMPPTRPMVKSPAAPGRRSAPADRTVLQSHRRNPRIAASWPKHLRINGLGGLRR